MQVQIRNLVRTAFATRGHFLNRRPLATPAFRGHLLKTFSVPFSTTKVMGQSESTQPPPAAAPAEGAKTPEGFIAGTVDSFTRHLFVCVDGDIKDWPCKVEDKGGLISAAALACKTLKKEHGVNMKLTACTSGEGVNPNDILVFPDQIVFRDVKEGQLPNLENHLKGEGSDSSSFEKLPKSFTFVCAHGQRDERCGDKGPPVYEKLRESLSRKSLSDKVGVLYTSHVGGHTYAGNVLIYPGGDWYGYITQEDVDELVQHHFVDKRVLPKKWRGRMGMSKADQIALCSDEEFQCGKCAAKLEW